MSGRGSEAVKVAAEIAVPIAIVARLGAVGAIGGQPVLAAALEDRGASSTTSGSSRSSARDVVPSLMRILLGFGIGSAIGVALGVPLGLSLWARKFAMPHIEYWRAMPPPALLPISVHPPALDREPPEGLVHRVLLHLPGAAEHDRRRPRARPDARRHRPRLRRPGPGAHPAHRAPGRLPADLRGDADEPLARRDHHGRRRVLLVDERRRLRAAHLEEHVPARADVGRDRPDRRHRLRPQPRLHARRAAHARLAPRLAGGDAPGGGGCSRSASSRKSYGSGTRSRTRSGASRSRSASGSSCASSGPSGCGKTTLLKCIAGLLQPHARRGRPPRDAGDGAAGGDGGRVPGVQPLADAVVDRAEQRPPAAPPQEARRRTERTRLVEEALEAVGLTRFIDHYPVAALRRDAAARRDRARPRLPALDPADGRAVRVRRRADARRPRGPRPARARRVRDHDPLRDARHRRVRLSLRPDRRANECPDRREGGRRGRPAVAARPARDEGASGVRAPARVRLPAHQARPSGATGRRGPVDARRRRAPRTRKEKG